MDYECRGFLVQCCIGRRAFPSGGHVGPSLLKVVVPVARVSLCMLFFSPDGDRQAVGGGESAGDVHKGVGTGLGNH